MASEKIVSVAFLNQREVDKLAEPLSHCIPVVDDGMFDDLLSRLDQIEFAPLGNSVVMRSDDRNPLVLPSLESHGRDPMADDTKDVGSPDRDRIAMGEEHEVRYWTGALDVTKERLQEATEAVGSSASLVRQYLRQHK